MKCHCFITFALLSALSSTAADKGPPLKLPLPDPMLEFEHRSAKPEPFLDRLASALFGSSG
jgi:hypothetical protein